MTGEGMSELAKWVIIGSILNTVATPYFAAKKLIKKLLPKKIPFVAVLVEHPFEKGYYLAVSRPGTLNDFNFPGGHVEKGESLKKAANRELREETMASAKNLKVVFIRGEETAENKACAILKGDLAYPPICGLIELEKPILNFEGCAVKWTTKEGLCKGSFANYNKALFQHLGL